jgi:hypothetical protein
MPRHSLWTVWVTEEQRRHPDIVQIIHDRLPRESGFLTTWRPGSGAMWRFPPWDGLALEVTLHQY